MRSARCGSLQCLVCFRKLLSIVKFRGLRQTRSPAPDRDRLLEELKRLGGKVLMTSLSHEISELVRIRFDPVSPQRRDRQLEPRYLERQVLKADDLFATVCVHGPRQTGWEELQPNGTELQH